MADVQLPQQSNILLCRQGWVQGRVSGTPPGLLLYVLLIYAAGVTPPAPASSWGYARSQVKCRL